MVRKSIARVLTVINQTQKENLRKFYKVSLLFCCSGRCCPVTVGACSGLPVRHGLLLEGVVPAVQILLTKCWLCCKRLRDSFSQGFLVAFQMLLVKNLDCLEKERNNVSRGKVQPYNQFL